MEFILDTLIVVSINDSLTYAGIQIPCIKGVLLITWQIGELLLIPPNYAWKQMTDHSVPKYGICVLAHLG